MRELHVVVDLQFGSCGKGLLAGYLGATVCPDTIVTAWAPNSGHTYIDAKGVKRVNIAMPNGSVSPYLKRVLIGPGSVINVEQMLAEIERDQDLLSEARIMIHEHAAVVLPGHKEQETLYAHKIGSTMKGVGAAVIQKIRRDPDEPNSAGKALIGTPLEGYLVSVEEYNEGLNQAGVVLVEGAQGFSLSINQGFYPYTTSRDCTTHQVLSDCGIPFNANGALIEVHGVCRSYPIRVANRFDRDGKQIGTSGPCYHDQRELKWSELGMEPELTTVTKLPRRIFTFSMAQIQQAIRMDGVTDVFYNFANYPEKANGIRHNEIIDFIEDDCLVPVRWTGHGPTHNDVRESQ